MLHPDGGPKDVLSDRFGKPVNVGDEVVIALKPETYRRSGAVLTDAVVRKLTPLIEKPGGPWYSTSQGSRIPLIREDQLGKSHPTEYYVQVSEEHWPPDVRQCLVAAVEVKNRARLVTVPFGHNLIVK
jgi:hypothetical protein